VKSVKSVVSGKGWVLLSNTMGDAVVKIEIDAARDLVKVHLLSDVPVADSRETEGMLFGYSADRRIVQIEIRGAKSRINSELLKLIDPAFARSAA
jgi:hypothetical protein